MSEPSLTFVDGTLTFFDADQICTPLQLSASDLLQLGADAVTAAIRLDPGALPAAAEILASVVAPLHLIVAASEALKASAAPPSPAPDLSRMN